MIGRVLWFFILKVLYLFASGAPQTDSPSSVSPFPEKPMPYDYNYKVHESNSSLYFGAQEVGNEAGRVEGSYYVLLPDKRLMRVKYYIDGDSGFIPTITFEENANPFIPVTR